MAANRHPCSGCLARGQFLTPIGLDSVARQVERGLRDLTEDTRLMSPTDASTKLDLGAKSAAKSSSGPFQPFSIACVVSSRLRSRLAISSPISWLLNLTATDHRSTIRFSFLTRVGSSIVSSLSSIVLYPTKLKRNPLLQSFPPSDVPPVAVQNQADVTFIVLVAHTPLAKDLFCLPAADAKRALRNVRRVASSA
jgi:hypothetical protein